MHNNNKIIFISVIGDLQGTLNDIIETHENSSYYIKLHTGIFMLNGSFFNLF